MDYTQQPTSFKIRKVLRYVRLYGVSRTRVKVQGQLHMKRHFKTLPAVRDAWTRRQTVALVGCGNYSFSNIAYYLTRKRGAVIGACMDVDADRAASMAQQYNIPLHTTDAERVLNDSRISLVYIASNHASHAEYAIQALERRKHVYIEKPHVVTQDQLMRLSNAMAASDGRVFLGFNRPGSLFGRLILESLAQESGAGMYNWFVAGHAIDPEHWYFRPEEGGRVLGNLCHWTDFILRLAGEDAFPVRITPTRAQKSDADIAVTYTFPNETIAVITFSAKGHTFEGVRERLAAHRGNCLIVMDDYETMTIEVREVKRRYRNFYRDHGHARNILGAYDSVTQARPYDRDGAIRYVRNTAHLFLKTKEALETNQILDVSAYASPATVGAY